MNKQTNTSWYPKVQLRSSESSSSACTKLWSSMCDQEGCACARCSSSKPPKSSLPKAGMSDRVSTDMSTCKGAVSLIIVNGYLNPLRSLVLHASCFHVGNHSAFYKALGYIWRKCNSLAFHVLFLFCASVLSSTTGPGWRKGTAGRIWNQSVCTPGHVHHICLLLLLSELSSAC